MPPADGISNMRSAREQRSKRQPPPSRHPRTGADAGAGAPAPPAVPASNPEHPQSEHGDGDQPPVQQTRVATTPIGKRAESPSDGSGPAGAATRPQQAPLGAQVDNQAAKRVSNAALGWAASMRKVDQRAEALRAAIRAAVAAGVPQRVIDAHLADAEYRSGGHAPPTP